MGMLATTMNGLALQDTLENIGIATRIQTAINMEKIIFDEDIQTYSYSDETGNKLLKSLKNTKLVKQ